MKRKQFVALSLLAFLWSFIVDPPYAIIAAQSDLDPTFGSAGKVIWSPNNNTTSLAGTAMALQADGKIVMTGGFSETSGVTDFRVARFNADGTLDTTFGTAGVAIITFGGTVETARSVAIQPDGKIVAGGRSSLAGLGYEVAIARLHTDGSLDTTFSGDGKVTAGFTVNGSQIPDEMNVVRVMPNGKIVFAGGSGPGPNILYYRHMGRLNADGSSDATFGTGGLIIEGLGSGFWHDIIVNSDSTIFAGGSASGQFSSNTFIHKLSETGSTLWTWEAFVQPGCYMALNALAKQADGKILAAGSHGCRASVIRINTDGILDNSFIYGEIQNSDQANAVAVQPDGKVIASFTYQSGGTDGFSLARYNTNGSLDATFGSGGVQRTRMLAGFETARDLVIQPDGKFLLGGSLGINGANSPYRFALARYKGLSVSATKPLFDYDGDGKSDVSVFRPSENAWYILRSSDFGVTALHFSLAGDIPTPGDYDGDGKTDLAIFRPSSGDWWYLSSVNNTHVPVHWGQTGDIPRPSDFDGDGRADFVVYRPSDNAWYRNGSMGAISLMTFGIADDKPLVGDFDGDGKSDPAVFRPSTGTWWYAASSAGNQHRAAQWGIATDMPVPGDYDGDRKTDFAVYRPSSGDWYILQSGTPTYTLTRFGLSEDKPVVADYDGDGKSDIAIFRPSTGVWYQLQTTGGFAGIRFGLSDDIPTPSAFTQ